MKRIIFLFALLQILACQKDTDSLPVLFDQLDEYISTNADFPLVRDSLIACAAGGQDGLFSSEVSPVSIFFYPEGEATEFQYFETSSENVDPDDLSNYQRKSLDQEAVFNGYLRRFLRAAPAETIWCRVTFVKSGRLHISNAIRVKIGDLPTEYNPNLLTIDQTDPLSPVFTWDDGRTADNAIYFHVVLDSDGDLLSGTYTFERQFRFYDLSNVVLNIRDVSPVPQLQANQGYTFVLMGVSADNWVNLLLDQSFDTN
ncbi:MAG: hypothetical protein AAFO94_10420 [Bacteroidota bacterium]